MLVSACQLADSLVGGSDTFNIGALVIRIGVATFYQGTILVYGPMRDTVSIFRPLNYLFECVKGRLHFRETGFAAFFSCLLKALFLVFSKGVRLVGIRAYGHTGAVVRD